MHLEHTHHEIISHYNTKLMILRKLPYEVQIVQTAMHILNAIASSGPGKTKAIIVTVVK